jgi:hypothetical protein
MAKKILHSRYEGQSQDGKKCTIFVYREGGTFFIENALSKIILNGGSGGIEDKIQRQCGLRNVRLIDVPNSPVNQR